MSVTDLVFINSATSCFHHQGEGSSAVTFCDVCLCVVFAYQEPGQQAVERCTGSKAMIKPESVSRQGLLGSGRGGEVNSLLHDDVSVSIKSILPSDANTYP